MPPRSRPTARLLTSAGWASLVAVALILAAAGWALTALPHP
jgi:hypothetical protein